MVRVCVVVGGGGGGGGGVTRCDHSLINESTHSFKVLVNVGPNPVVYEHVPLTVIGGERGARPPVLKVRGED